MTDSPGPRRSSRKMCSLLCNGLTCTHLRVGPKGMLLSNFYVVLLCIAFLSEAARCVERRSGNAHQGFPENRTVGPK